jgi:peptidoglycan/LPS O-acetylase OafA/YrhL
MTAVELKISPNYRPDIDGLRALAVLSVVLFHINETLLPGGFVGVDVFFVISGYLITFNIASDIEAGRFTILDFYRRRVKRIAPAMLVCVGIVILMVQILTIPEDAERAAESAIWSLASLANVYFWLFQDQSYFAQDSRELPFLHLWSLGVEEQFYLAWPLLVMLLLPRVRQKSLLVTLGCAAILSYASGQIVFKWSPSFAYYMIPCRAGELLAGAILGIAAARGAPLKLSRAQAQFVGLAGLALVVGSFFALSEDDVFPGLRAIPPTLGCVMLIAVGQNDCGVSKALSVAPLVWIGLVSYSAYLWHWPLLAFLRYGFGQVGPAGAVAVFILTFLLAGLSYRFVEQPARHARCGPWKVLFGYLALPAAAIGAFCLFLMATDAARFRPNVQAFEKMRPAYAY